ncbi:MAG: energy transducer TonB [Candidatus Acidiferrales bacterium]
MACSRIVLAVVIILLAATAVFSQDAQKEPPPPPSPASDSSQSNAPTTRPVRVPGNVASAMLIHQVTPVYPAAAKEQHIEGTLLLHAIIGKDGTLQNLTYVSGPPILMSSAMEAVKQWQYKPTLLNGEPVEVDTTISVVYALGGKTLKDVMESAPPPSPGDTSQPDASASTLGHTHIGATVAAAQLIHQVAPVYPPIAKTAHISGTVVLHVIIAQDGTIKDLQYVSGPPLLMKSAMDAVREWVYRPTLVNDNPVEVDTTVSVVYTLGGKNPSSADELASPSAVPGSSPELPPLSAVEPSQDQQKEQTAPQTPASTSSEPNSSAPKRTREGHVTAATLIYQVTPVYPRDAKKKHIQGTVTLNATIAKDGSVENLVYESGPPMLMASAMEAVKKWRYKPTVLNGEPVAVNTAISVTYTLGNH